VDGLRDEKFDYMLSNPPFGVDWKKAQKIITDEYNNLGYAGRFGAGLPRISDGSLLFLQHMIAKMKPRENGGSRIGIVFNGSPLFTGQATAKATSANGSSKTTGWKPLSPCPTNYFTTPAFPPTSGYSTTTKASSVKAKSS
jgi:hypothetical protein